MSSQLNNSPERGFSLIELLIVIAVLAILLAFAAPALTSLGGNALKSSGTEIAGVLSAARSSSISERKVHGVGVVISSSSNPDFNYRAIATLVQEVNTGTWSLSGSIQSLDDPIAFDLAASSYIANADYASREPRLVTKSTNLATDGTPITITTSAGDTLEFRVIRFDPSGRAHYHDDTSNLAVHLVVVEATTTIGGNAAGTGSLVYTSPNDLGDAPTNWVQISVDHLTGRTRMLQP